MNDKNLKPDKTKMYFKHSEAQWLDGLPLTTKSKNCFFMSNFSAFLFLMEMGS